MNLRVLTALVFASAAFAGVFIFALLAMPAAAIFTGSSVPLWLFIAARESDAAREDARWIETRRHPRP